MLVNFDRRICFLLHPKTASRAIFKALTENSGFVPVSDHHACWREELWSKRKMIQRGLDPEMVHRWDEVRLEEFVYAFVIRNPFDTLASWYEDITHGQHPIGPKWYKKFIRLHPRLFPKNGLWPYLVDRPPGATVVLRYESIQRGLCMLSQFFRFPNPGTLEVIGKTLTRAKDYRDYYSPESRQWAEETFAADIEAGGYTFGEEDGSRRL